MSNDKKLISPETIYTYTASSPEYIGKLPVRQEKSIIPSDVPVKGWTVKKWVAIDGNKYLRLLSDYLKKVDKKSEDDLTAEEVENLYSQCETRVIK